MSEVEVVDPISENFTGEVTSRVTSNWLTKKADPNAATVTTFLTLILCLTSYIFIRGQFGADAWMSASGEEVFNHHQYWRLWSAMFAHADAGHLISNLFLFIPLTYWLTGYFGYWLFPFSAFLSGGVVNYFVLKTMPLHVSLLGVSGVVYWMGAAWLTLLLAIDRRHSLKRRFASAVFLFVILFVPETYDPNISYYCHLFGFIAGMVTAGLYFVAFRKKFQRAEVKEYFFEV